MKIIFGILSLLFCQYYIYSQSIIWEQNIKNNEWLSNTGSIIHQLKNGNIFVANNTYNHKDKSFSIIAEFDKNGYKLWEKMLYLTYRKDDFEVIACYEKDNGDLLLFNRYINWVNQDSIYIIQINKSGDLLKINGKSYLTLYQNGYLLSSFFLKNGGSIFFNQYDNLNDKYSIINFNQYSSDFNLLNTTKVDSISTADKQVYSSVNFFQDRKKYIINESFANLYNEPLGKNRIIIMDNNGSVEKSKYFEAKDLSFTKFKLFQDNYFYSLTRYKKPWNANKPWIFFEKYDNNFNLIDNVTISNSYHDDVVDFFQLHNNESIIFINSFNLKTNTYIIKLYRINTDLKIINIFTIQNDSLNYDLRKVIEIGNEQFLLSISVFNKQYKNYFCKYLMISSKISNINSNYSISKVLLYPNPLLNYENLNIRFYIGVASKIIIDLYNDNGQKIKRLSNVYYGQGNHVMQFNLYDNNKISNGAYQIRMILNNNKQIVKPVVIVR